MSPLGHTPPLLTPPAQSTTPAHMPLSPLPLSQLAHGPLSLSLLSPSRSLGQASPSPPLPLSPLRPLGQASLSLSPPPSLSRPLGQAPPSPPPPSPLLPSEQAPPSLSLPRPWLLLHLVVEVYHLAGWRNPRGGISSRGVGWEAEGGTRVSSCPVPIHGTPPPVTATKAISAGGPATSPTTPPLAADGVTIRPAEAVDTRSAFFGASGRTKSRGAAL
ncbi:vegetative cell wall protein gp1-like [Setaria italica]|uniref:vegetative cell wall protein gp1-like n=1 Tax=Setaria italica TaxID=4555 RepID=UPI0003510399|nr:vegetative cell wall protein gp1-like [Setaria italica]